jgi:ribosomal protein L37E
MNLLDERLRAISLNVPETWICKRCGQKNRIEKDRCSQCSHKRPENLSKTINAYAKQLRCSVIEMMKDKNFKAKLIAMYVRNNIEDFHAEHLSDEQMRELNPLIRNAIYTAIVDIEEKMITPQLYGNIMIMPDCWEDCEYIESVKAVCEEK